MNGKASKARVEEAVGAEAVASNYRVRAKEAGKETATAVVRAAHPKGTRHAKAKEAAGVEKVAGKVRRLGTYRGNKQIKLQVYIRNDGRHLFFMLQSSMQGHQVLLQLVYTVPYLLAHFAAWSSS